MAGTFNAWRQPFDVMLTVPLAALGGLIFILLFGSTINIFSQIALIVLIGIATKNSILIVDWANQLRVSGKTVESAIVESCKRRFRPIMMTSLSTLIAMVPLIVGNIGPGAGEGIRLAVGCTIFGGMLISTFLTLFTTPVFYLLLCKNSKRMDEIDIQLSRDKTTNKINGLIIGDSVFSPEELRGQGFSQTVIDQLIAAGDDNTTTTQGN